MRTLLALMLVASVAVLSGCGGFYLSPVVPPIGAVYADVTAPQDADLNSTGLGSKVGESSTMSILSLIALGDCSTKAAAEMGDIQTIYHADYHYTNILGIYQKYTTIVYGD